MGCGHRSFGLKGKASLSLASSPRMASRSASFIPVYLLSLLRSILLPLLVSIQRIRSRGDCEPPDLSVISALFSLSQSSIFIFSRTKGKAIQGNNFISLLYPSDLPSLFSFQNRHQCLALASSWLGGKALEPLPDQPSRSLHKHCRYPLSL
jgi:hypothetical protein